ncbi:helix-turn-helix domain-containing protein [Micromonospora sp. WMMD1082]|uniref:helix-turn-helix domain-containing protein n=1 Tax=Micromonospora sp. WMMD1082 TaxID=3016104 RepID=UPI00241788CB|nr:helix-turn-helix domain-containing protein [Micromonospora sp. WMMD1082]MDG4792437.1 helix-turn-helix domain-containing protein [Micromonospora sp. WMMD1082]
MSQHVKAAMLATKGLGKNERAVAVAIAAHMNSAGDAWPSVATIADYADCSERTVQRAIARLINLGRLVWRHVTGIATRVYRLVVDAVQGVSPAGPGVPNGRAGVTEGPAGGDTQDVTRSSEDHPKEKPRAGARDWRRWIPKSKARPPYPERRGAALPPPPGGDRCQRPGHVGQPARRCIPCLSEALAGGAR